jgi:hypothetical protein
MGMGIEKIYSVFLFLNVLFLVESCLNYNQTHRERYVGPVVAMVTTVGIQQCVEECLVRPGVCEGINYKTTQLLCEIVTSTNHMEPSVEYVRIELNDVSTIYLRNYSALMFIDRLPIGLFCL